MVTLMNEKTYPRRKVRLYELKMLIPKIARAVRVYPFTFGFGIAVIFIVYVSIYIYSRTAILDHNYDFGGLAGALVTMFLITSVVFLGGLAAMHKGRKMVERRNARVKYRKASQDFGNGGA